MRSPRIIFPIATITAAVGLLVSPSFGAIRSTSQLSPSGCASITKALVVASGFTHASAPKITPFNDKNLAANISNSLGETIDFGSKSLVVGCASPTDLKALSIAATGKSTPTMSATKYVQYLVKSSAGSMKGESLSSVPGYVDYGNGKEDGLGSTSAAGSVRLDTFAAGNYVINFFSSPISPVVGRELNTLASMIVKNMTRQ